MNPIAVGGGVLAGAILLALAVTAGGCRGRMFAKKSVQRTEAKVIAPREADTDSNVHRRELDELLPIE